MAIDLVDLSTLEIYGPFETPADAKASAERSGFTSYALWEDGKRIELVGSVDRAPLNRVGAAT